ncbi:hypothetical protein [Streptomyces sp. NBC_00503]|uniref:hypothetical protein n=1 Tax=Streptomyces sp. NBC_00503 TaxID=2903659 RepID=UPI002E81AA47|nr:hypothetical protein [Streptomyces sp. NBC_00503]WUD84100.1 hypothetical protein OG490_28080 [Streptomyces sp. NBC_00503]
MKNIKHKIGALIVSGSLSIATIALTAPAAHANTGDILVQQYDAAGQLVSTQDYLVANLLAPKTIHDPITNSAVTDIKITNLTLQPITAKLESTNTSTTITPGKDTWLLRNTTLQDLIDLISPPTL